MYLLLVLEHGHRARAIGCVLPSRNGSGFNLQIRALEHMRDEGIRCHAAAILCFSKKMDQGKLRHRLGVIHSDFKLVEEEELLLYPPIKERLKKFGFIH